MHKSNSKKMKYNYYFTKLESFWQRRKWWILSTVAVIAVASFFIPAPPDVVKPPSRHVTDSINFVNARARFNAYSTDFVRVNALSGGMADEMRDSVNIYYRIADSLKTVYEQSRPR